MSRNVEALKNLAVALCSVQLSAVTGNTIDEVIDYIADNYTAPTVPDVPTEAGTYNVVVDSDGAATWTAVI